MNFKEFYLTEMFVIGKPQEQSYVVAFDKWIWVLDDTNEEESKKQMNDIGEKLGINSGGNDVYEFINHVQETISDVLVGQINNNSLHLFDYGSFKLDPKSSVLVKKVVNQLKLKSASYIEAIDDPEETKVTKKKMTGNIPDVAYHGTSSKYLRGILSKGLRAAESDSNYAKQGIVHYDLIFFSTRIGEALHHATHTAHLVGGIPIILEHSIPDKALIVPDYDVKTMKSYKTDKYKVSKEVGVYGYSGNIKPVFIKNIYVAQKPTDEVYNLSDFKKMSPSRALKFIEYYD